MTILYAQKMYSIKNLRCWAERVLEEDENGGLHVEFEDLEAAQMELDRVKNRTTCLGSQLAFVNGPRCFGSDEIIEETRSRVGTALEDLGEAIDVANQMLKPSNYDLVRDRVLPR